MNSEQVNQLKNILGDDKADDLVKLVNNYDKYVMRFKKNIDSLLSPMGYTVKTGCIFETLNKEKTDGY